MHASTRILIGAVAVVAIVGGWWVLFAINHVVLSTNVVVVILYGVVWTAVVVIATRLLLAVGFGFNRLTAGRERAATPKPADAADALAELTSLRDRELISAEEYEAKRAAILERL
ncbi:MAG: SHOCT domain-containing protein [Candidatus Limnocylindrales bacterium]